MGVLAGLLLGHQMSPGALESAPPAMVTAHEPVFVGVLPKVLDLSSVAHAKARASSTPVVALRTDPRPDALAAAIAARTAGAKGTVPAWLPSADAPTADAPRANPDVTPRTADAGRNDGAPREPAGAGVPHATKRIDRMIGRAFYQLAYSQQQNGHSRAALRGYARAAALDPSHASTFYNWGALLERQGALWKAVDKYVRAIWADPAHRFAWYNLGYLLQTHGEAERAIEVYESAIAAGAGHALTFYNLGWLEQTRGALARAARLYREAIARDPGHALAHYNLGYLLQLEGDLPAAAAQYRAVLEFDPDHEFARENLSDVEALLARALAMNRR